MFLKNEDLDMHACSSGQFVTRALKSFGNRVIVLSYQFLIEYDIVNSIRVVLLLG